MKKIIYTLIGFVALFSSCNDLDYENKNIVLEAWASEESGTLYMNDLYNSALPTYAYGENANNCDEGDAASDLLAGRLEQNQVGTFSKDTYAVIRRINLGIEGCTSSSLKESAKERFIGQMRFLRAYLYFEMTKRYGGVPLVFVTLDAFEDDLIEHNIPRSSAKVCFERILEDLDYAVEYCADSYGDTERGRVTKMIAAAFRGRVALTYASELFNPQNDQDRWEYAYQMNLVAKNKCVEGGRALYSEFGQLFVNETRGVNTDIVWVVPYDVSAGKTHGWESSMRPLALSSRGSGRPSVVPTASVTDAFPMKDGRPIGESSTYSYDVQTYWKNRDPRLYNTIAYNGSVWVSGASQWTYQGMAGEDRLAMLNLGAYCRKASNPNIQKVSSTGEIPSTTGTDWQELRYAEVLLNLAECANEAGHSSDAYTELYALRKRAGIEEGTSASSKYGIDNSLPKAQLRKIIMNERFIELAFEGKRYWDLRRRLLHTDDLEGIISINNMVSRYTYVVRPKSPYNAAQIDAVRDEISGKIDDVSSTYFTVTATKRDQSALKYLRKYYFFDVPLGELDRCPAVEQTIGWVDDRQNATDPAGTFDPLSDQGGTPWKDEFE